MTIVDELIGLKTEEKMKIKAKTKDGEIVTIIGTHTDFYIKAAACIDKKGKSRF